MLAMAKSMRAVCSRAGLVYGDRLMRLPRRLGFDATAEKLEESLDILETDLGEYTEATTAWLDAGASLAREILATVAASDSSTHEGQNLHVAMLEDLAKQMAVSAELDNGADLRPALKRYALGLRSYLQTRRGETRSSLKDLQALAGELSKWLARADPSHSTDLSTGLANRAEIEREIEASWSTARPISALIFEWREENPAGADPHVIAKQLADRLADLVRPHDIVGRWNENQFAVIFECSQKEAMQRAHTIAEWLTGDYSTMIEGAITPIHASVTVSVIERLPNETPAGLVQRIEEKQAVVAG
jgi:GGDEF domain-containing protein